MARWVCWKGWGGGVWEGFSRGVNERQWKAQWSSDANCFYSHSSPLPVSDFSTSNDLPLLLSPPLPFIPLLICPIHSLFSSLSCFFFSLPFPLVPLYESPSIYFSLWLLLLYSLSIYPPQSQRSSCCIYLHVVEKKEEEEERSRNTLEVSVNHYH